jgi:hypothetical protein
MSAPLLEYSVSARRLDAHASEATCKSARVALDTDLARNPQAFNPAELLLAALAACMIKGIERVTPIALERAGWKTGDVERIEINEAFAAIALACLRELGLSEEIVNVEGGAIAHGHAIGATGAVLTTRLLHSMRRDGLKRGVVTLCIGGGQGIALALEMT